MVNLTARGRTKSGSFQHSIPVDAAGGGPPSPRHAAPQRSMVKQVWVMTLVGVILWVTMQIMFSGLLKVRNKVDNLPPTVKDTSPAARARAAKTEGSFNPHSAERKPRRANSNPRKPKHMDLLNRRSKGEDSALDLPVDLPVDFDEKTLVGGVKPWGCKIASFPLFFYHIPKTGGGTVRSLLRRTIKKHDVSVCWQCTTLPQGANNCLERTLDGIGEKCREKMAPLERAKRWNMKAWTEGVVMGHYNLGAEYAVWPAGAPRDAYRIVQLRDPVERMRSLFMFGQGKPEDLLSYIKKYDRINGVELSKKLVIPESKLKGLSLAIIRICGQTCPGLIAADLMTPRQAIERAKSNLRTQFTVVGVTEEMDLFFKMLGRRFAYLSTMEGFPAEKLVRHKADPATKELMAQELVKKESQDAMRRSSVLAAETELYEVAVQVMKAQWSELEKCPNDAPYNPQEEEAKPKAQREDTKGGDEGSSMKETAKGVKVEDDKGADEDEEAPEEERR